MTTLADEFLNDMNDLDDSWAAVKKEEPKEGAIEEDLLEEEPINYSKLSNTEITQLLNDIQQLGDKIPQLGDEHGIEHSLIIRSNEMVQRINNEISNMYKIHIREIYCKKFPELEHQVFNPLDYTRVVRKLGNNLAKINELSDILPASNIITISMTASSTNGKDLSEEELTKIFEACDFVLDLDESRQKILSYVESRMKVFAPNLTEIVGSEIAAKLIGAAGSLQTLATMPSGNIQVLGRTKKALSGFSKIGVQKLGFLGDCEILQTTPQHLEVKACRVIANKCSLAARLDLMHGKQLNGEVGLKFREEIERAIEKWQEPPPARKEKPLRAPDDIITKRRGGVKLKKRRQQYAPTELSKKANRLPFAKITEDHGNSMKSLGMLGLEGSGQIRLNARDDKGMVLKKKKVKGTATSVDGGFATSVYAITPMQGLELRAMPKPQQEKPFVAPTTSYFSNTGFFNLQK